ncbi:MAG: thymidine kinase, partial [Bacteroidia bacterium]|nr:thymidine kinase [Bacteroidia bacterium]
MFVEHTSSSLFRKGCIEVICGSMFSGKTEELIRRLKRAQIAKLKVEIFKPDVDSRYHQENIVSHNATGIKSVPVKSSAEIIKKIISVDVVGVDEVQFFDKGITKVCSTLANKGVRVIAAGLDMDYKGRPFGPMAALLACAEYVTKVHAICIRCGDLAHHSYRKTNDKNLVMLGESSNYEALCRSC